MQPRTENVGERLKTGPNASALGEPALLSGVLAVTALVYAATLGFGFVYDDLGQIVRNTAVQSWRFVPDYFRGKEWQALFPNATANYYRPFNFLWFRVNDAIFGMHPAGWHAMGVALHILVTCLAYFVARRVTGRPLVAALTALLFGVHPMRHEVVAWVSGTTESLWAVFFFLAFFAYLRSREHNRARWIAVSCLCYAAGLLAKETAIVLPVVVLAHAWIYGARVDEKTGSEAGRNRPLELTGLGAVYGAAAVAYLCVRIRVLHGFEHPQSAIPLKTLLFTLPSVMFFYVRQWLLPLHVGEFYDLPLWSQFNAIHVLVPLAALVVLGAALWLFRERLGRREVAFALVWMIVPLLPVLDFAVLAPGQLVHDRYFYLPSFGAALVSGLVLGKLANGPMSFGLPRRLLFATLAVLMLLCYGTANATSYWRDDYTLFKHAYETVPTNVVVRVNYAIELARKDEYFKAMPILLSVLQEQPNNWLANYNLGRVFYDMGMLSAAEGRFERTRVVYPTMPDVYLQLGLIDLKTNRTVQGEANLQRAVDLSPDEPAFRFSLGVAHAMGRNCAAARMEFERALVLQPGFPHAQEQISTCGSSVAKDNPPATAARAPSTASPGESLDPVAQVGTANSQ
jgi:hypothetical protein